MKTPASILAVFLCTLFLFSCNPKPEKKKEPDPQEDAFQKKLDSLHEKNLQKNSKKKTKAQELDTLKSRRF